MRSAYFVRSIVCVVPFLLPQGCAYAIDDTPETTAPLGAADAGRRADAGRDADGSGGSSARDGGGDAAESGGRDGGPSEAAADGAGTLLDGGDHDVAADTAAEGGPGDAGVDAGCVRETVSAFCTRLLKDCGSVVANDICGVMTTASCGTCDATKTCGGGGVANLCGAPGNLIVGGTVAASNQGTSPEDMTKAFDGNVATKWYAGAGVKAAWISYQFAAMASHQATSYTVTSGNDNAGRDPYSWQFQGSNDGMTWVTVDSRSAQAFASRGLTKTFAITGGAKYSRYRLNITAVNGGTDLQLAEIQIFGN